VGVMMIDRLGGGLLYPFFSLYLTSHFGISMSEVGLLFAVFSIAGLVGSLLGGSLTDRMGRRWMIILSLVATSLTALAMGLVNTTGLFFVIAFISGLFAEAGTPAYHSAVADLLPQESRAGGFAILRVGINLSAALGPLLGGLIATRSYLGLFAADAIFSLAAASIVFGWLPETLPALAGRQGSADRSAEGTTGGYLHIFRDLAFMLFFGLSTLAWLTYANMDTTLGVYLRDWHGVPPEGYGVLLALNGLMVLLLQLWVTRRAEKFAPMLMMALAAVLFGIGFGLYGIVSGYAGFLLAMAVITFGEMISLPLANALVSNLAPEDMRGRYNAVFGMSWVLAFGLGPFLGGLIMDSSHPDWLWFACGLAGALATIGFLWLQRRSRLAPLSIPLEQEV
jgi:MFS family permease